MEAEAHGILNEVLDDSTTGGAKIVSFEKDVIGEGAGFVGELTRLTLTYDGDAGSAWRTATRAP